jgi:hypothetical protein
MLVNINLLGLALSPVLFYLGSAAFVVLLSHLKLRNTDS